MSSSESGESGNGDMEKLDTNSGTSELVKNRKKNMFFLRRWARLFRRIPKPRPSMTVLEMCVSSLRGRARVHMYSGAFDMVGVIFALYFMANSIAIADRLTRLEESVMQSEAQQQKMQERVDKILGAADKFKIGLAKVEIDPKNPEPGYDALRQRVVEFEFQTALPEATPLSRAPVSDAKFITQSVSVLLSRAVILVCGLLVIQILVLRYKFNSKMAGQYEAMGDALLLAADTNKLEFEKLILSLMPKMEFGSMPKPMIQELLETLRSGAEAAKKG